TSSCAVACIASLISSSWILRSCPLGGDPKPTARVARPGVPRPRSKSRLRGTRDDVDARNMRANGRSTLQMSWLATALAGVLGIATPAVAHLAAEKAAPPPAQVQIASSGAGVSVALLHDQPYPPRTVARPDPPAHRGHPADAKATRAAQAVQPPPGSRAHRSPW